MIHLSQNIYAKYIYKTNKKRKNRLLKFTGACLLVFILVFMIYADIIPSKPKFARSIYEPVALVKTPNGYGSAFLVGQTYLITAKHVVNDMELGDPVDLSFMKAEDNPIITTGTIEWISKNENLENDFALLKLSNPGDLPETFPRLQIGVSSDIPLASDVTLIGYPGAAFSITNGQISNDEVQEFDLFQLDVSAWPGSSGGPLILTETEQVIGVLTGGMEEEFKGINIACKIDYLTKALEMEGIDIYE